MSRRALATLVVALSLPAAAQDAAGACGARGVALQVLGSGGPETQDQRASSSYLLWQDGRARVLIDAGGGAALRFGQAGATMAGLDLVLFTHLHADHSADFPALVKSSFFEERQRALPVLGPPAGGVFPGTPEFLHALFGPHGAWRYLSGHLEPGSGDYLLQAQALHLGEHELRTVFAADGVVVQATRVEHGPVPAIAYRVELGGHSIVFSGDTNGDNGNLERLARGAQLLVAHNAVPEGAQGVERRLHMPPSVIGRIARIAAVGRLVLSHRMLRTLGKEAQSSAAIRAAYAGPLEFADDLSCYPLAP